MPSLILTVIGPDRPGLVRTLSEAVTAHGGSWLESRMARLAGQFAGIVLVEAPESLLDDLRALEGQGLRIVVQSGSTPPCRPRRYRNPGWRWRSWAMIVPASCGISPGFLPAAG